MQLTRMDRGGQNSTNILLGLIGFVLIVVSFFTTPSPKKYTEHFKDKLQKKIIGAVNHFSTIDDFEAPFQEIKSQQQGKKNFYFLCVDENLDKWNTAIIIPSKEIIESPANIGFSLLQNGYYFWQKKYDENKQLINLIPIRWNYQVTDNNFSNEFIDFKTQGKFFSILQKPQSLNQNVVINNKFLFALQYSDLGIARDTTLTIVLRFLGVLCIVILIQRVANASVKKSLLKSFALIMVTALMLVTLVRFNIILNFRQFEIFDPSIYSGGKWLPSLGFLLALCLAVAWPLLFLYLFTPENNRIQQVLQQHTSARLLQILVAIINIIAVSIAYKIISSLVIDSQVSFNVLDFYSLNRYSLAGLFVITLLSICVFLIIKYTTETIFKRDYTKKHFLTYIFILIIVCTSLALIVQKLTTSSLLLLGWLLLLTTIMWIFKRKRFVFGSHFNRILFWIIFFASSTAVLVTAKNNSRRNLNDGYNAQQIANIYQQIDAEDLNTIQSYFTQKLEGAHKNEVSKYYLQYLNKLADSVFTNYEFKHPFNYIYQLQLLFFDSAKNNMNHASPIQYSYVNQAWNAGHTVPNTSFKILKTKNQVPLFIAQLNAERTSKATAFLILGSIDFFDAINAAGSLSNITADKQWANQYEFAIYKNGIIVDQSDSYNEPNKLNIPKNGISITRTQGSRAIAYFDELKNIVVVVTCKQENIPQFTTLFSYLFFAFSLTLIFIWLVYQAFNYDTTALHNKQSVTWPLRYKIYGAVIGVSLGGFLLISIINIAYLKNSYQANDMNETRDYATQVENQLYANNAFLLDSLLNNQPNTNIYQSLVNPFQNGFSQSSIQGFSLFNGAGKLQATLLTNLYVSGIVAPVLNPTIRSKFLNNNKVSTITAEEPLGAATYTSFYKQVNIVHAGKTEVAYLQIPLLKEQQYVNNNVSRFTVTVVNAMAFVFIISAVFAIFIAGKITQPLALIAQRLTNINLNKRNEQIPEINTNDEVEALVKEYNTLVNKLEQSTLQLMQQQRNIAWGEMAKQVAHEIKNPLTPMKLNLQFLATHLNGSKKLNNEQIQQITNSLITQIDHLNVIATNFSMLAKTSQAKPEILDVKQELRNLKTLYNEFSFAQIIMKSVPEKSFIYMDKNHFNRVMVNLLNNAVDAITATTTTGTIFIDTFTTEQEVIIELRDTGVEVNKQDIAKLFEPNFSTKTSGTGLGLAITKQLIELAGGSIRFFYDENNMKVFEIRLPKVSDSK